ncbi:MAG: D-tyrosyl-tRNA(Tyr) deacylase [Gammaproteobacteria bacterium]|jgi:D-aminoacyl-tRNA deacylase|nr:D-tyrosyl-tRNA(Tyr) deacylase [Gammaproteobacteria bacterium]
MIGLLQRVRYARVEVQQNTVAEIDTGLLVFIGVERMDDESKADRLLKRLLGYRVFSDHQNKMNLSVIDVNGGLLLVPQFTLAADTRKGMRPGFSSAATPEEGQRLFDYLLEGALATHNKVANGLFGADMQISLCNDGPVTFTLSV